LSGYDFAFKVILFGDAAVGKTALAHRYLTGLFRDDTIITLGVQFHAKDIQMTGKKVKLQILDFGGEERFRFLLPSYCQGANGGIFMFDVTDPKTLYNLDSWLEVLQGTTGKIPIIMVGNKIDLVGKRAVEATHAMSVANNHKFEGYVEVSAKTGEKVENVFEMITKFMIACLK
jgi:small GTP-binding protein